MSFPSVSSIWQGSILHSIVHAIVISSRPVLTYELHWDSSNYTRQNTMGTRGVITFGKNVIVGAFSDINSNRHVARQKHLIEWTEYFCNAPDEVIKMAKNETLLYMLEEYEGEARPIITSAFWSENHQVISNDTWQIFIEHGGHLIQTECLDLAVALNKHQENWEMSREHIELAHRLYMRRLKNNEVTLTLDEYDALISKGTDGIASAKSVLATIGVLFPSLEY